MTEIPDEWLNGDILGRKEVAAIFNVDPNTVTNWAKKGRIGFFRTPGGTRCFPEAEIRRMMAGLPVPDYVVELAAADRAAYQEKWEQGWRRNEYAVQTQITGQLPPRKRTGE